MLTISDSQSTFAMLASSNVFFSIVFFLVLNVSQLEGSELFRHSEYRRHPEATDAEIHQQQFRRSSGAHFDYSHPKEWGRDSPNCWGSRQSPIDLNITKIVRLKGVSPLYWKGYEKIPTKMTLKNNGHSVEVAASWNDEQVPYISGGVLEGEYTFAQFHFHWGSHDEIGSEHTINGHRFPLELHLVHYKKEYGSFSNATKQEDGLAVVGVLYKIKLQDNRGIAELQRQADKIKIPDSEIEIKPFSLSYLNVNFQDEYVAYLGSLTTPPCSEIVTWIIPAKPNYVTPNQINFFRSIRLSHNDDHNYRPTMPLNGRTINYVSNRQKPKKSFMRDT